MSAKASIRRHEGLPLVFSCSKARAATTSAECLYAYRYQDLVEQVGRGLYSWADAPEIDQDLLEVACRAP